MRLVFKLKLFFSNGSPQTDAVHPLRLMLYMGSTSRCINAKHDYAFGRHLEQLVPGSKIHAQPVELQETQNIHYCSKVCGSIKSDIKSGL